jgi:hypothetical protein
LEEKMASHPNPDRNIDLMKEKFGTKRLVTDYYPLSREEVREFNKKKFHSGDAWTI